MLWAISDVIRSDRVPRSSNVGRRQARLQNISQAINDEVLISPAWIEAPDKRQIPSEATKPNPTVQLVTRSDPQASCCAAAMTAPTPMTCFGKVKERADG